MRELNEETISQLLEGIIIPPQPQVLQTIIAEQRKSEPDLSKITKVIGKDIGISAAILRSANSPAFGLSRKVTSINHAVMLLGMRNITSLITGLSLRKAITAKLRINLDQFWENALDTALLCAAFAQRFQILDADQGYLIGLFHNCGVPIIMQRFPDYVEKLKNFSPDALELPIDLEEEYFHINHCLIGSIVARSWYLPEAIRTVILHHHDEELLEKRYDLLSRQVAMLALAEHLVHEYRLRDIEDKIWSKKMGKIMQILEMNDDIYHDLQEESVIILSAA